MSGRRKSVSWNEANLATEYEIVEEDFPEADVESFSVEELGADQSGYVSNEKGENALSIVGLSPAYTFCFVFCSRYYSILAENAPDADFPMPMSMAMSMSDFDFLDAEEEMMMDGSDHFADVGQEMDDDDDMLDWSESESNLELADPEDTGAGPMSLKAGAFGFIAASALMGNILDRTDNNDFEDDLVAAMNPNTHSMVSQGGGGGGGGGAGPTSAQPPPSQYVHDDDTILFVF